MRSAIPWFRLLVLYLAWPLAGCGDVQPMTTLRVALVGDQDECEKYCIDSFFIELLWYEDGVKDHAANNWGDPLACSAGVAYTFEQLDVGGEYSVAVEAVTTITAVESESGDSTYWTGTSESVTVPMVGQAELSVELKKVFSTRNNGSITHEWVEEGVTLTLEEAESEDNSVFGDQKDSGESYVEVTDGNKEPERLDYVYADDVITAGPFDFQPEDTVTVRLVRCGLTVWEKQLVTLE